MKHLCIHNRKVKSIVIIAVVMLLLFPSCSMYNLEEMEEVQMPNGEIIYLKCFEHNGWKTLVISSNSSKRFSPENDYISEGETSILYSVKANKLEICTTLRFTHPENFEFDNAITFSVLENVPFHNKFQQKEKENLLFFPTKDQYMYEN